MGFFKDLKEDFSQAMNDLMPEDDLNMEDYPEDIPDEFEDKGLEEKNDSETEEKAEDEEDSFDDDTTDKRDIQDVLEEEVLAAINALNTEEEMVEVKNEVEQEIEEEILEDGLTEEELIQRMIDEDERIKKEQEAKEQELRELELNQQELKEHDMEEQKMTDHVENKELETEDDAKDMELIAQLLGEDNNEDTEIDEDILADSDEVEETKEEIESLVIDENRERGNDVTVITKGTKINGSISSDGSLEIMGTINGDIDCLGKLSIVGNVTGNSQASEIYVNTARLDGGLVSSGSVKVGVGTIVVGDVKASSAVIAGAVKGEVDVNGPVVIDSTAIVKGNINAKSVQINNGAVVDGYCSLTYASVDIDNFFDGEK